MTPQKYAQLVQSVQSCDKKTLLKSKVATLNKITMDTKGVQCELCGNKGVIFYPREDGSYVARDCSCKPLREFVNRMEESGMKDVLGKWTFENFQAEEQWQRDMLAKATAFAENPKGWFFIGGQSGSGKSHLCTAICYKLLKQHRRVTYVSWRSELSTLKDMSLDGEERRKRLMELKTADVLYLDDLFKIGAGADGEARPTSADISLAYDILNIRCMSDRTTIISSEYTAEQIRSFDEATAGRIFEKAGREYICNVKKDPKRDYRLQKAMGA